MSSLAFSARSVRVASASRRYITSSARLMDSGATGSGSSRPGGVRSGDAFTRREQANEEMYFRREERLKLEQLRKKIQDHKTHLDDLDKSINEILKENGKNDEKSQ